jgi:hypothetical protein
MTQSDWLQLTSRVCARAGAASSSFAPSPTTHQDSSMAPVVNKTLAVLAAAGIGVVTYAIYFDHKRRTDANFRKRLRMLNLCILPYVLLTATSGREKKKLDKSAAQEAASSAPAGDAPLPTEEILAAMARVKDDQVPTTPEEREKYFMSQVEKGEQLCARGRSTLLGLWRTFAHSVAKGQTLPLRLHWRSSGPFAFILLPSS